MNLENLEVCERPLNPNSTFTFLTFRNSDSIITPIITTDFYNIGIINDHVTNKQVDRKSRTFLILNHPIRLPVMEVIMVRWTVKQSLPRSEVQL